ncbi:hypothetical protein DM860_009893 [Cuscuta australis]|uniref:Protein kinase domain-containing protein n=1 Tax=Cuscuta australis TaxID=267555 RepID=A0A328DFU9_9ASTE|nr:hypothetical protein DM860_009893 [Cuscuta australis]
MDISDDTYSIIIHDPSSSSSSCDLKKIKIVENPTGHNIHEKYFVDVHRRLGRGSFGVVHVCADWNSGRQFACKTVWKANLIRDNNQNGQIEDLRNEVAIMRRLKDAGDGDDGKCVVSLRDVYEDDEMVHVVMDLCRGGTLFDVMVKRMPSRRVFREDEAAMVIRNIVRIIQMLHEKGIIHRDVKPENFIYANKSGHDCAALKIIDFGIAHFFKPGEKFNGVKGTPSYMAPELLRGDYGPEIDIWSAGFILYALLTLNFPFAGEHPWLQMYTKGNCTSAH